MSGIPNPLDLFEPATDWTGQALHERIKSCAQLLYLSGYQPLSVLHDISDRLQDDLDHAGEMRAQDIRP